MSDEPEHGGELPAEWPSDVIGAEEAGVRVFWVSADTMQGLVDRLALVLGEHMADGDELHVTYNAMQSGWQDHAPRKGNLVRSPTPGWTTEGGGQGVCVSAKAPDRREAGGIRSVVPTAGCERIRSGVPAARCRGTLRVTGARAIRWRGARARATGSFQALGQLAN